MRVIVCGGRNVGRTSPARHFDAEGEIRRASTERKFVFDKLSEIHAEKKFSEVIAGNEGGAERLGASWAAKHGVGSRIFARRMRKETIIERNSRMLKETSADLLVAFGSGQSTKLFLDEAKKSGIPTLEFDVPSAED